MLAFAVRLAVLNHHRATRPDGWLPYTLEGALQFHYAERVAAGEGIPDLDPTVQRPEGLRVRESLSTGPMLVTGTLHRWSGRPVAAFHDDARILSIAFASAAAVAVAWWAWALGAGMGWGVAAGALYAVMPAAVARSSGIEFMGENFALPFLFLHLALVTCALTRATRATRAAWGAAVALAAGLWLWDMGQTPLYLLAGWLGWRSLRGRPPAAGAAIVFPQVVAAVAVGLGTAYGRAHGVAWSPAVLALAAWTGWQWVRRGRPVEGWIPRVGGVVALVAGAAVAVAIRGAAGYGGAYGHFAELLVAKLRYLNCKPSDPALLSFDARILWVPALHSASVRLTRFLFPVTLWCAFGGALIPPLRFRRAGDHPGRAYTLFLLLAFFLLYVLMVRFQVFLAGCAAVMAADAFVRFGRTAWRRAAAVIACVAVAVAELTQTAIQTPALGRRFEYYTEFEDLIAEVREQTPPDAVILANFGIEPPLMHYAERSIVLHPKFESRALRDKVRDYGEALFLGGEGELRAYCDRVGADWYVYSMGEFSDREPRYTMRYCVDALDPPETSAARRMEYSPDDLRWFVLRARNRKYVLFEVIGVDRTRRAEAAFAEAEKRFHRGRLEEAFARATEAAVADPGFEPTLLLMERIMRLHEAGFGDSAGADAEAEGNGVASTGAP